MSCFKRYNWFHNRSVSITGNIWMNGATISPVELEEELFAISTFEQFNLFILKLNGHFTIVKQMLDEYWVATDPILRFPLFYRIIKGEIEISDEPMELLEEKFVPDLESLLFFLQFGTTFRTHTLASGLSVFDSGTITRISSKDYYSKHYIKGYFSNKDQWEYTPNELKGILEDIFSRYLNFYKDRFFVVPLTAGYDSRLIVSMLKKYGFENVYCVTWGRKNNPERSTAKKVSAQLNYKYQFIEYDNNLIKEFNCQELFIEYIKYSGSFISMPYMQDYFGVKFLKEKQIIPKDAVFIPGHTGDGYSGSHQRPWFEEMSKYKIRDEIIDHFAITGFQNKPFRKEQINALLEQNIDDQDFNSSQFVDYWDINIRQARFVVRSSSVFDFFGYDVLLPLSDQQFIHYFLSAPMELRYNEMLYRETLVNFFFKPCLLDFDLKDREVLKKDSEFKKLLKNRSPQLIKKIYYPLFDAIYYREITKILISELDKNEIITPDFPHKYNSFLIQWYLKFIFGTNYKSLFK